MNKRNILVLCIVCLLTIALGIALILIISNGCGRNDPEKVVPTSAVPQNSGEPNKANEPDPTAPAIEPDVQTPLPTVTDAPQETDTQEPTPEPTKDPLEIDDPEPTPTPTPKPGETPKPTDQPTPTPAPTEAASPSPTQDDGPIVLPELP